MYVSKLPDGKPEIYKALQGEGMTTGKPCIFIRLSGCNLGCHYCDSAFTWFFEGETAKGHSTAARVNRDANRVSLTPKEVAEKIAEVDGGWSKRVVFTGGEPLLQQKEIWEVIKLLRARNERWNFELETNGAVEIDVELAKAIDYINCSPKLSSSGNSEVVRDNPKAIKKLCLLAKDYAPYLKVSFKFVVNTDDPKPDLEEIDAWKYKYRVANSDIYLMPEGISEEDMLNKTKILNAICMEEGYNLTTRLHILLFGNQRAV